MEKLQLHIKSAAVIFSLALVCIFYLTGILNTGYVIPVSLALFCLLGIPHGANDFTLFQMLREKDDHINLILFLSGYLIIGIVILILWKYVPLLALSLFLLISCYHFGQANWSWLRIHSHLKTTLYFFWGGFILAGSLLWNYAEAQPIISSLLGFEVDIPTILSTYLPIYFFLATAAVIGVLYLKKTIKVEVFLLEMASLIMLSILFVTTHLLVGFTLFFVLWHSSISISDQVLAFQKMNPKFTAREYWLYAAPLSFITFLFLGVFLVFTDYQLLSSDWIGAFFVFISSITIPHSILMDRLLEKNMESITKPNRLALD